MSQLPELRQIVLLTADLEGALKTAREFFEVPVGHREVEVHLLGPLLGRPRRRPVIGHLVEGDALAVLSADRSRVGGVVDLPIQQRAVEPGERTRIGDSR